MHVREFYAAKLFPVKIKIIIKYVKILLTTPAENAEK